MKIIQWEQWQYQQNVFGNLATVTSLYFRAGTMFTKVFESKGYLSDMVRRNNQCQLISRLLTQYPEVKLLMVNKELLKIKK